MREDVKAAKVTFAIVILIKGVVVETKLPETCLHKSVVSELAERFHPVRAGERKQHTTYSTCNEKTPDEGYYPPHDGNCVFTNFPN